MAPKYRPLLLAERTLVLPEIRTYRLDELGAAFRESEAGHLRGKLVVTL
jgi:D-arabinose 1-dehydrogenase-like Zn-dependent alcohol dehydrogenase